MALPGRKTNAAGAGDTPSLGRGPITAAAMPGMGQSENPGRNTAPVAGSEFASPGGSQDPGGSHGEPMSGVGTPKPGGIATPDVPAVGTSGEFF